MKFGGTSVADAERIGAIAEIVRSQISRRPVVVVSALGQATDLLEQSIGYALRDELEALDPLLARLQRTHRWAVAGVEEAETRHQLGLEVDRLFEDLGQRLRSIRILGEGTPRAADALLAFGEDLAARIVSATFRDRGLKARMIDARELMITDDRFGAAEPDVERVAECCRQRLLPVLEAGEIPVLGGFVGATAGGDTTTLGRGGSDTSAAVFGAATGCEEIQIWTDVDGLMSADPRLVPSARTVERVSFDEAAELAYYGARVLHPASVRSALSRGIPVRVLNSMRPGLPGTLVVEQAAAVETSPLAIASRAGVAVVRCVARPGRKEPGFPLRVLETADRLSVTADLIVTSEDAVTLVLPGSVAIDELQSALADEARIECSLERAILCVVGSALSRPDARGEVLAALAQQAPELVVIGASGISVAAVVTEGRLEEMLRELHRRFFERSRAS